MLLNRVKFSRRKCSIVRKQTCTGMLIVTGQNKSDKEATVLLTSSVIVPGDGHVTPTGTFAANVWENDHFSTQYGSHMGSPTRLSVSILRSSHIYLPG